MLRTMLSLSALTLGVTLAFSAQAAPTHQPIAESSVASTDEGIQVAQNGDYQVFYDGKGNRVIVDPYTGKVIAIQPPQTRFDRRALRLENRERRVERVPDDERYYLDDPEDMARFRRRQMEDRRAYQYPEDDSGFYDNPPPADGGMVETFPPAPGQRDRYGDPLPANREGIPAPQPVERQPLKEASIDPAQPTSPDGSVAPTEPSTGGKSAINPSLSLGAREDIAALQVLLDRAGASPGAIDGRFGSNMDKALAAYREITGTNLKSTDVAAIKAELDKTGGPAFASYSITPEDAAGPYARRSRKTTARRRRWNG